MSNAKREGRPARARGRGLLIAIVLVFTAGLVFLWTRSGERPSERRLASGSEEAGPRAAPELAPIAASPPLEVPGTTRDGELEPFASARTSAQRLEGKVGSLRGHLEVSGEEPFPGLWRLVFPTNPESPDEELMSDRAVQARLQNFFPSSTPYDMVHRNLYVTHQRVAGTFRLGRVVLAGDAAHVNNPIGGMGLNGGLQDAANLSNALAAILLEGASDRRLDLYDRQRRTVAVEFVQHQSIENKRRLEARDPAIRARHLAELRDTAADPVRARQFLLRTSMIASQRRAAAVSLEEAREDTRASAGGPVT
jgi:hypothetical protein